MKDTNLKAILDNRIEYRDKLFARGFLFTDVHLDSEAYPFYGIWKKEAISNYYLYVSPKQHYEIQESEKITMIIIGHAYNPFSGVVSEKEILKDLSDNINDVKVFWNKVNQLTGVFTLLWLFNNKVYVCGDATCMQTTFYTLHNNRIFIASHTELIADLIELQKDQYVEKLIHYKFFPLLGNSLPGDLTLYRELKRMVPNHYICLMKNGKILTKRFYTPHQTGDSESDIVEEVADILHQSMVLIPQKWNKPGISMTGGCDSKTTLACTNGEYDKYTYFSYISSEAEKVDAEAAAEIAKALSLKHTIYHIPEKDNEIQDIEVVRRILDHNTGDIIPHNKNDVRKRAYFADTEDFDVEVKSWASEIGRSYYSKRFHGRKEFGEVPTPRKCTTLYKFFLHDRRLVRQTDKVFAKYLKKYFKQDDERPVEWQEQFFWEYRVPAWNGLVITGEHRYSFDITIPYNNRILLNQLMSFPIEKRISDWAYQAIRDKMNPDIDATGIVVQNLKHTKRREQFENMYYIFNTMML